MKAMKWLVISQSAILFGTGIVFPFYIIFIREIGANFTEFGFAYALFALSAAAVHKFAGEWSDSSGRKSLLLAYSWGSAVLFLLLPIVTSINQVYVLQVLLGILGALHKTGEKALVGDFTDGAMRGKHIGVYHGWVSVFSALAIVVGGYLIDLFTLAIIFYIGSLVMFISGLTVLRIKEPRKT